MFESPERDPGPPRGHPRALGPRSGHQPNDPRRAAAGPQVFAPSSLPQGGKPRIPTPQASEPLHKPSSPAERLLLRPQPRPPRCPRGTPSAHPAAKLTRLGVFLRSFSCSPRRLSRGGQLCSLHLPVRLPPFFTSPEIASFGWDGGAATDEGGAAEAEREAGRPERWVRFGGRGAKADCEGVGAAAPRD